MTRTLYNQKDVTEVRGILTTQQNNKDAVTGLDIPVKQQVLDHNHKTQFVRAVLHRQVNAALGKIEGIWTRYLSYWYPYSLSHFLRQVADYLEKPDDTRWIHPGWKKRAKADFNKLTAAQRKDVLTYLIGESKEKNDSERKDKFSKLLNGMFGYDTIRIALDRVKE
jgi:hypothetical protein